MLKPISYAAMTNQKQSDLGSDTSSISYAAMTNQKQSDLGSDTSSISYAAMTNQKQSDLDSDTSSVTHQYGISALISQTLFRRETSGGVGKCRLFSQAL